MSSRPAVAKPVATTVTTLARLRGLSTSLPRRTRDPVRERLEGHDRHDWRQHLGHGRGGLQEIVRDRLGRFVAFVAQDHNPCAASLDLGDVGHDLSPELTPSGDGDDHGTLVDERDGPMLHLSGRIGLCPDVGELLQLERTLECDGVAQTTTQEVDVLHLGKPVRHRKVVVHPSDCSPTSPGRARSSAASSRPSLGAMAPRWRAKWRARSWSITIWVAWHLVDATPISGPPL